MLPKRKEEKHMEKMTHKQRIMNAIACERVDRTAYNNFDGGLLGRWADPEFCPGDMYLRPEWAMDKIIEAGKKMGGDTAPVYFYGPIMAMDFTGVYYKTPGRELPADTCFEAIETNPMKDCINQIREAGLDKDRLILIGGTPIDENTCKYVNADEYVNDAQKGLVIAKNFVENAR